MNFDGLNVLIFGLTCEKMGLKTFKQKNEQGQKSFPGNCILDWGDFWGTVWIDVCAEKGEGF